MAKAITLEESFFKLEEIIGTLEEGQVSLDESFQLYREGIKYVQNCNTMLDKVEKQIIILNENGDEDEL